MKSFKGIPSAAHSLEKNCVGIKITYTKELCNEALQKMILGFSKEWLKQKYGDKILDCFTMNDIENFSQK